MEMAAARTGGSTARRKRQQEGAAAAQARWWVVVVRQKAVRGRQRGAKARRCAARGWWAACGAAGGTGGQRANPQPWCARPRGWGRRYGQANNATWVGGRTHGARYKWQAGSKIKVASSAAARHRATRERTARHTGGTMRRGEPARRDRCRTAARGARRGERGKGAGQRGCTKAVVVSHRQAAATARGAKSEAQA